VLHRSKEDRQFQIIGVTEPRFSGVEPGYSTDLWIPCDARPVYVW